MAGPLKPTELVFTLPEGVFDAFNEEIRQHLKQNVALIPTQNLMLRIMKHMGCAEADIPLEWLKQAKIAYEREGWWVKEHQQPHSFFEFRREAPYEPPPLSSRERWEMSRRR